MGVGDAGVSSLIFHSFAVTCETVLRTTNRCLIERRTLYIFHDGKRI